MIYLTLAALVYLIFHYRSPIRMVLLGFVLLFGFWLVTGFPMFLISLVQCDYLGIGLPLWFLTALVVLTSIFLGYFLVKLEKGT